MKLPVYQVDAFTNKVFSGNPAAVCPLETWLDDSLLQSIANENNLSETAFFVREEGGYRIRWFTPEVEVDLCGHATLASGFVIFNFFQKQDRLVTFSSKSGKLTVEKKDDLLALNFPAQPPVLCEAPENLIDGLGKKPLEALSSEDYFVVFSSEEDIIKIRPDFEKLKKIDLRGVIVTAKGKKADFVSRFFAPRVGVNEDPVTGSAHCALIPYWAKKLNKKNLHAHQVSSRGGELFCEDLGERVEVGGRAVLFMEGTISI
ncbi:MAG: PhzF family phenazine biosynthesis protein [Deltaproteobacteria bacterium]|nr:PhzF family phenazine biosynthesis protein [Deltaproteobacteria bacterium]